MKKADKDRVKPGWPLFKQTFFALSKSIDTPHSLARWLCLKYGDHNAFIGLEIDPASYGDSTSAKFGITRRTPQCFAYDLAISEFGSKYKGLSLGIDTEQVALSAFKQAEANCALINKKLKPLMSKSDRFEAIILMAQRKISDVLGSLSGLAHVRSGWGPGSTFSVKGDVGWDLKILEDRISVTPGALPWAQMLIGNDLHWCRSRGIPADGPCSLLSTEFQQVPGNRITTVHKNAKTDRTIAIEPTANVYLQKIAGAHIRRRLRKMFGIDLDSQRRNQIAARNLNNATIDLKAASDSISEWVVRLLLPEQWIFLLDAWRSPNYYLDDRWHSYQKWSSMGNGYTFELETLIFASLAHAVQSIGTGVPQVTVYGDDIIVPTVHAESTIEVLRYFGFETNVKKTHYKSLYRESCGVHFFDRFDVTPIYQKEIPSNVEEIYHMANRIRHLASRLGDYRFSDIVCQSGWRTVVKSLLNSKQLNVVPFSPEPLITDPEDPYYDPSLSGAVQVSVEDLQTLGLPLLAYGSKHPVRRFTPKKRKADHAAGLALTLSTGAPINRDLHITQDTVKRLEKNPQCILTDITLDERGRGRWCTRKVRVYRSYISNAWL